MQQSTKKIKESGLKKVKLKDCLATTTKSAPLPAGRRNTHSGTVSKKRFPGFQKKKFTGIQERQ